MIDNIENKGQKMNMKAVILSVMMAAGFAVADVVPTVQWDVETGRLVPVPYALSIRRGESVNIEPRFLTYNTAMNLTGAAIQLRYWYTGQTGYYATTGSLMAATGRVHIAWSDALCPASNALNYEVRATLLTNVLARAYGSLTLLTGSSGTATNGEVRTSINWALIDQAGGTAVLSNQLGSGATWTGTNWTFAGSGAAENFGTNASFLAVSNTAYSAATDASLGVTNVTGGILSLIGRQISLVTSNLTAVLDSVYAALIHDHTYTAVTNAPWVVTESDPTTTNLLDLAGTRAMTGNSVTLARDVKSRDATSAGLYGVAFGDRTSAGDYGAAFGDRTIAGSYGAAFGSGECGAWGAAFGYLTSAGNYGAAFGEGTTADNRGASFGYLTIAGNSGAAFGSYSKSGEHGFSAGYNALGTDGSFVFSDSSSPTNFDRQAYVNSFSVRAIGGTYFETPNLTATGTITATSFNGSGASLTGITAGQVGASATGHVHDAGAITNAPWLTNVTAAAVVAAGGLTNGGATVNGLPVTNGAAIVIAAGTQEWTLISTGQVQGFVTSVNITNTSAYTRYKLEWSAAVTNTEWYIGFDINNITTGTYDHNYIERGNGSTGGRDVANNTYLNVGRSGEIGVAGTGGISHRFSGIIDFRFSGSVLFYGEGWNNYTFIYAWAGQLPAGPTNLTNIRITNQSGGVLGGLSNVTTRLYGSNL